MRAHRIGFFGSLILACLVAGLSGCGGGGSEPAAAHVDSDAPPLHSFDIYALGSATGNELFADVYGITLDPLRAYRLTADQRVSWVSASESIVAVAAADEQIDKLALLQQGGVLAPLPGLGRPHAFVPEFQPDGTIRYQDNGRGEAIISRYMSYDPTSGKSRVLYRDDSDIEISATGPANTFLVVDHADDAVDKVIIMDTAGKRTSFRVADRIGSPEHGRGFVTVPVYGSSDVSDSATATGLIDLKTGKVRIIDGWAELGWTPDRLKVLVTRVLDRGGNATSELAVLDPSHPDDPPEVLGSVPIQELYMASWVHRSRAAVR